MEIKKVDGVEVAEGGKTFSAEEIKQIQQMMYEMGKKPKTSGGNKKHMSPTKRKSRRAITKASRKVNRKPKKSKKSK